MPPRKNAPVKSLDTETMSEPRTSSTPAALVTPPGTQVSAKPVADPPKRLVLKPVPKTPAKPAPKATPKLPAKATSKPASKPPPKTKGKAKPKSPEYVESGSDGEIPSIANPPKTPKTSPRKRAAKNYAESDDSDFSLKASPRKKRLIVKDEVKDVEDPFVEPSTNFLVDDVAEEDNTLEEEEPDDVAAMVVDEGDSCEEGEVEDDGEDEEATEPTESVDETPEPTDDLEEETEDVEDAEDHVDDAGNADPADPSSDLSALPEEEWDEDAFYDTALPTEKNPFDILPGILPPHDMSVSEEAMDPELIPFKVYDYENLSPLVPGNFVAPSAANINIDNSDGMIIMNMENWYKMGVVYKGSGQAPHPKAIHIKDLARIMAFKQAYSIASPALANPTDGFRAKFIGSFAPPGSTSGDSIRWEVHLGKYTCLFVDTVGITASHLKQATPAFGTTLRYATAIDHRFFMERKMGFFNTVLRKPELELRMLNHTTFSYETKSQNTVLASPQALTPKKSIFGTAAKMTYNASPSKSTSSYTKAKNGRLHTFDSNEDVPVYDGTDPKKPIPTGFKLLEISKYLDSWDSEVPEGALALMGYIAHLFYWRGVWRLKFYVQWVVVLGIPGKSINDALKGPKKTSPVKKVVKNAKSSSIKK